MRYFYVICPVGADSQFAEKRFILSRLGREHGIEPFFPLEAHDRLSVASAIRDMRFAEFVMADLSLQRPSCYFELGMALGVGVDVFLVAADDTLIHQVGDGREILFYGDIDDYRLKVSQVLANYFTLNRSPG
jgi:hypothetical protein